MGKCAICGKVCELFNGSVCAKCYLEECDKIVRIDKESIKQHQSHVQNIIPTEKRSPSRLSHEFWKRIEDRDGKQL
jgi:hypothetical protein